MFSFIKKLFGKKETVTFSTTLEPASEGVSTEEDLHPEISELFTKLTSGKPLATSEIGKLTDFYLGVKLPSNGLFIINKGLGNGLCFSPTRITSIGIQDNKVADVVIELSDLTLNSSITVNMSVKDFYDVFEPLDTTSIQELVPKE